MKSSLSIFLFALVLTGSMVAQSDFDPTYQRLRSGSFVQDKNFYLFTLIEQLPQVKEAMASDKILAKQLAGIQTRIASAINTCTLDVACLTKPFYLSDDVQTAIGARLVQMYDQQPVLQQLVKQHMRPSGMFMKYAQDSDQELLRQAWLEAYGGMAFCIDTYAKGKKGRYPKIDSVSYDVNSFFYQRVVRTVVHSVEDDLAGMSLFYQPTLQLAMTLLDINRRDEAGRHEPMAQTDNRLAFEYIPTIDFSKYRYACILQPGHGPELEGVALSPLGKMRVKLVAKRYHDGWAPLIILSGGYVHPYQTPYAEATEMKKALIEQYGVPERAIIIEPHARHTTTNFRNASRLMYQYGIPTEKSSVCTTTFDQIRYITDPQWRFDERNMKELGYLPYLKGELISRNDLEFRPVIMSMHADPLDPLDP